MTVLERVRHPITLYPESARVIVRAFIPGNPERIASIVGRALRLSEPEVGAALTALLREFGSRHTDLDARLESTFRLVAPHVPGEAKLSPARRRLIGGLFSGEYALESAALFNPSIVEHPDQRGLTHGSLRFVLSLRATGEGHISSIEFRAGVIDARGAIHLEPTSPYVSLPDVLPDPTLRRAPFVAKFGEMGFDNDFARAIIAGLPERFTVSQLDRSVATVRSESLVETNELRRTLDCITWLAKSNYELRFSADVPLSERIIFPVSSNESNGIEDARFVRFRDDDGTCTYFAAYTAYDGRANLPQLIETPDFLHFRINTLNGNAVQNKGMALFPRRIGGRFAMLSRQDDENLFVMYSDRLHFWSDPTLVLRPEAPWESVKIGNCGSPLETEAGWLVLTHGVGPMRKYCIGAALLDRDDPSKVLGRLATPLVTAEGAEREGYVPNVAYSCGSLIHAGHLILPYAMSDKATTVASFSLAQLLAALTG